LRQDSQDGAFPNTVSANNCCMFAGGNFETDIKKELVCTWWAVFQL
jgi:hypothetical protein